MKSPGRTWCVAVDDDHAWEIEGVAVIEVAENGTLMLSGADGRLLGVFAPGAWRDAQPVEGAS